MKYLKSLLLHRSHIEAFIWIVGLLILILSDPYKNSHYSLCMIKNSGLGFCPGCGIGHSIGYLFRGDISQSFKSHPLGLFAIIVLCHRIFHIFKNNPILK